LRQEIILRYHKNYRYTTSITGNVQMMFVIIKCKTMFVVRDYYIKLMSKNCLRFSSILYFQI